MNEREHFVIGKGKVNLRVMTYLELLEYLAPEEFPVVFKMSRDQFLCLPKWKQLNLPVVNCSESDCHNVDSRLISFGNATVIGKLYFLVFALLFAVRVPFLSLQSDIMGLLIIGFALWEAWKINKRPVINITGPHILAPPAAMPPTASATP